MGRRLHRKDSAVLQRYSLAQYPTSIGYRGMLPTRATVCSVERWDPNGAQPPMVEDRSLPRHWREDRRTNGVPELFAPKSERLFPVKILHVC